MHGSPIMAGGKIVGVICREEMREIVRRPSGSARWCFHCHKTRDFVLTMWASVEPSYYDPSPSIRCAHCNTSDGDMFPGRYREWIDE